MASRISETVSRPLTTRDFSFLDQHAVSPKQNVVFRKSIIVLFSRISIEQEREWKYSVPEHVNKTFSVTFLKT